MPYTLIRDTPTHATLRLWPHNTLNPRGFVWAITLASGLLVLPLLGVLGTPVLWGLLPFEIAVVAGLWFALKRNWRDRAIVEEMDLGRGRVHLRRIEARRVQEWQADPHWTTLHLTPRRGPVPQYLTLTGGGREVELGAFLTPDERIALHDELTALLRDLRSYA
jgi:uncharacterized membrane protein